MEQQQKDHFNGKEAVKHVTENYAKGVIASSEIHGTEIPGSISAACDALRESALVFLLFWLLLSSFPLKTEQMLLALGAFSFGWIFWKAGRSAFLGWSRLERLHRISAQEKWEIEHNRMQEREELTALYAAKGFSGKLLNDVIDVLMSDSDLLLRVMLQEELGLSLEVYEHPLKQAFGAFIGSLVAFSFSFAGFYFFGPYGLFLTAIFLFGVSAFISAKYERNDLIHAIVWNVALLLTTFGIVYFLQQYFLGS